MFLPGFFDRPLEVVSMVIFLYAATASFLFFPNLKLPRWQALINLAAALVIPILIVIQRDLSENPKAGDWMISSLSLLLGVTAVRQHALISLLGLAGLLGISISVDGLSALASSGFAGAIIFVLAGLAGSRGLARADRESEQFRKEEIASKSEIATLEAESRERRKRLKIVLDTASEVLLKIRDSNGSLSDELKQASKMAESSLRDSLRGGDLMTPALKQEVLRLRELGVEVLVLDEGGTEHLIDRDRDEILGKAITALKEVSQGRVTIRSPKQESFVLTVVATTQGEAKPQLSLKL
jgi:hypothetical protein